MKYPKHIQRGGTIGFVAPSFGCQIEPYYTAFGNAQKKFREMGYQLQLGPNCYAGEGIGISNTPEKCGQELTDYYCSRSKSTWLMVSHISSPPPQEIRQSFSGLQ